MKVLDVESLQTGVDDTIKDMESKRDQIQSIQKAVNSFYSLEDALEGQGGEAIRAYYKDTHEPFLVFLQQSLIDYENVLQEMKDAVNSFEANSGAYVSQDFIENDVTEGLDKVQTKTVELTDDANQVIDNISDLVSVKQLDDSEVLDDVQRGKEKAKNIVEELIILDDYETSQLKDTMQDLETMRTFLSDMESKFKGGGASIQNYNVDSIKDMTAYNAIMDRINNKDSTTIDETFADKIGDLPMSEIEKAKNNELKGLDDGGKDILNMAFNDLEKGEIDRDEYLSILNGLKQFDKDIKNGEIDSDVSSDLVDYVEKNNDEITKSTASKVADGVGDIVDYGMTGFGLYQVYNLHRKGFEIESYVTKGGIKKYRVHNPTLVGISPPTKRDTKIYEKNYVKDQVRRGKNGANIRIASNVNVRAGAVGELKSKAGWLGVAIDTGLNVKDNIEAGESTSRIVGDAGVDVGIGAVSLVAAGAVSAAVVGTLGAPVIVGAGAALVAGYAISKVTDIKIGDKTISNHIKDGVQSGIKTVAGWFKK